MNEQQPACATVYMDDGREFRFDDRMSFVIWICDYSNGHHGRVAFRWVNHETGDEFRVTPKEDLQ